MSLSYKKTDTIALFVPCYVDLFYPQVAKHSVSLLKKLGVKLVYPKEQTCCGQSAYNAGYWQEAKKVVRHFCRVFADYPFIVTPSGSCAAMCRNFYPTLDSGEEVIDVGRRVFELTEFIVDVMGIEKIKAHYPHKVALHIGCHTRRELGIVEQPRKLLENVSELEICEIPQSEECCGFGGMFSVKMPELSLSMGRAKIKNIQDSGAEILVSTDVSCLMHLEGILKHSSKGSPIGIRYIAEIFEEGKE